MPVIGLFSAYFRPLLINFWGLCLGLGYFRPVCAWFWTIFGLCWDFLAGIRAIYDPFLGSVPVIGLFTAFFDQFLGSGPGFGLFLAYFLDFLAEICDMHEIPDSSQFWAIFDPFLGSGFAFGLFSD